MIRARGDAEQFAKQAADLLAGLRRALPGAVNSPARLMVEELDQAIPPRNQAAGEGKIAKDILSVLKGVPRSVADPAAAHRAARGSDGQTRPTGHKVAVNRARLQAYLKRQTRKAGRLKSSLNRAKKALGLSVPSWLARHGDSRGDFRRMDASAASSITIEIGPHYAPRVRTLASAWGGVISRARTALRENAQTILDRAARSAGL